MNKRQIGTAYEEIAAKYLVQKGHRILEQNYRIRSGEIDLITRDGRYLVFTEVKYRSNKLRGSGSDAVNISKQRKIIQTAKYYLLTHGYSEYTPCRFDIVSIDGEKLQHFENAYEV